VRGINKVLIIGRATRDTELRQTSAGKPVANLRIATNRVTRDGAGELKEHPQFHTVVVFDRLAETCAKYVKKGRLVYVEGRLETREFTDKEGANRETTEIIAADVQFLDRTGRGTAFDLPEREMQDIAG
jgi:single-strand DNA-binding protein